MSNKIVTMGDTVFAAWLDSPGTCMIRSLDLRTGRLSGPVELGRTEVVDNHCGPALAATSDRRLHAIIGAHNRPFRHRTTTRPADIREWTEGPPFPPDATYPSLVVGPDDTLHLMSRAFLPRGESCKLAYQRRPPGGDWSAPLALARTPSDTGYVHYGNTLFCDPAGVLHASFHFFHGEPHQSPVQGYLRSADGGGTWTRSDGTSVALPATIQTIETVKRDDTACLRGQGVAQDRQGRTYVLAADQNKALTAIFVLDAPRRWRRIDLLPAVVRYYPGCSCPQEGGITFDADGNLYVLLDVKPPSAPWADPRTEVLLLYSEDCGASFTGLPVSPPDPTVPHWLCSLERTFSPRPLLRPPSILYTRGFAGRGCVTTELNEVRLAVLERV